MRTLCKGLGLCALLIGYSPTGAAELGIPNGPNFKVFATAVKGKRLYVGGVGGLYYKENGVWHGMGKTPLGPPDIAGLRQGTIYAIKPVSDGIIVGGLFNSFGNVPHTTNIAKWNGQEWQALGKGVDFEVHAIEVFKGRVVVGGTYLSGLSNPGELPPKEEGEEGETTESPHLVEFDGEEWNPIPMRGQSEIYSLSAHGEKLYVGGYVGYHPVAKSGDVLATWDGETWDGIVPLSNNVNAITAIIWEKETLYIGGYFEGIPGNAGCRGVCRRRNGKWEAIRSSTDQVRPHRGQALCLGGGKLYGVGYYLDEQMEERMGGFYSSETEGWRAIADMVASPNSSPLPSCSFYEESLYIGMGRAWADNGQFNFARFDGENVFSGGGGFGDLVNTAVVWNGKLVVGGRFQKVLDDPQLNHLIQWDGEEWDAVGEEFKRPYSFRQVFSLDASTSELLIAGREFDSSGGKLGLLGFDGVTLKPYGAGTKAYLETAVRAGGEIYVSDWYSVSRMPAEGSKNFEPVGQGATFRPSKLLVKGKNDIYAGAPFSGKGTTGGLDLLFHWNGKDWEGLGVTIPLRPRKPPTRYNYWPDGGCLTEWRDRIIFGSWFSEIEGLSGSAGIVAWDGKELSSLGRGLPDVYEVDFCTVIEDRLYVGMRTRPWGEYFLWKFDGAVWEKLADLAVGDTLGIGSLVKWKERYYVFGNFNLFRGKAAAGIASFVN